MNEYWIIEIFVYGHWQPEATVYKYKNIEDAKKEALDRIHVEKYHHKIQALPRRLVKLNVSEITYVIE